jgi:hypothetical protein
MDERGDAEIVWMDRHGVKNPTEDTDYWLDIAEGGVSFDCQVEERTRNPSPIATPIKVR